MTSISEMSKHLLTPEHQH